MEADACCVCHMPQLALGAIRGVAVADKDADSLIDRRQAAYAGQVRNESRRDVSIQTRTFAAEGVGEVGSKVDKCARYRGIEGDLAVTTEQRHPSQRERQRGRYVGDVAALSRGHRN